MLKSSMNKPFFSKEQLILCDVPVPKGYPQSQTHSGVAVHDGRVYLTTSPFPGKKYSLNVSRMRKLLRKLSGGILCNPINGEAFENPCLYVGIGSDGSIPTHFIPMTSKPLMNTPDSLFGFPAYNSDPDIYIEDGHFYIMNRIVYRTKVMKGHYDSVTYIYLIKGTEINEKFRLESVKLIKEWKEPFVSPCLTKYGDKYVFTYLESKSALDAKSFDGLYLQTIGSIDELSKNECYRKVKVNAGDLLPWHMSLFNYEGNLYSIIACVKNGDRSRKIWQMFGEFNSELTELTIYQTPLTDFNSYRGSAFVSESGRFVLYETTVWEKISGGKSVDGREVMMAQCDFSKLLSEIKK